MIDAAFWYVPLLILGALTFGIIVLALLSPFRPPGRSEEEVYRIRSATWRSEQASETRAFPLRGGGEIWFTKKTPPIGMIAMYNQPLAFLRYRRRPTFTEMISWHPSFDMSDVSVSAPDKAAGSPKLGDMIARNSANPSDKWLIARKYFDENFEPEPLGPGE